MKKISMVAALLLTALSGCGGHNNTIINHKEAPPTDVLNKVELVYWHTYSEEETKVFEEEILSMFESEYPDIDIKPVRQAHTSQLKSAIIARASANLPPDIVRMDIAWLPKFAQLGLLYPVSTFADFNTIRKDLYVAPLQSNLYEGKYYGVPLNTNTKVAIYNIERLTKAGMYLPPQTMEELEVASALYGNVIGMTGLSAWESLPYFYGFGGMLLSPQNRIASGFLNSKDSVHAVERMKDLYDRGRINPRMLQGNAQTWQGIETGDYVMIDEGPWYFSLKTDEQLQELQHKILVAPFPVTNGKGSVLGGENLVIMKSSKHPEAAWTFIKWMMGTTPQGLMAKTGLIPTNKNVDVSEVLELNPYFRTYLTGVEHAFLRPQVASWDQIDQVYRYYMELIFSNSIDIETGLNKAAQEIDEILYKER
ncbi:extracellular solute-binding protein [Bacillus sp. HMF5848]|uniref:extracellular solute-binding protein n=1 Tax=Bacillus sp. HMF5848 TaxID=2495421 RepID=UPI000F7B8B84|nr:extracellular solute-binding protein [Bacillus sp. HMF5848]RSK28897.1 extracellular solute-binding protein [Bacillus sp. HMF5848]